MLCYETARRQTEAELALVELQMAKALRRKNHLENEKNAPTANGRSTNRPQNRA